MFSFVGCIYCRLGMFSFRLGFGGVFGSWLSGRLSHLLVVFTHSTGRRLLCRAGSEGFSLGIAGWTLVGGFGLRGPSLVESPWYLVPCNEYRCAFAPIETINKRDSKKKRIKEKKRKEKRKKVSVVRHSSSPLHRLRLKSQHHEKSSSLPSTPLSPDTPHCPCLVKHLPSPLPFPCDGQAWQACS